jgi:hypothetical protein
MLIKSLTLSARGLTLTGLLVYLLSKLAVVFGDLHRYATAAIILLHNCTYVSSLAATQHFKGVLKQIAQTQEQKLIIKPLQCLRLTPCRR